jgi:hypothetical protein
MNLIDKHKEDDKNEIEKVINRLSDNAFQNEYLFGELIV